MGTKAENNPSEEADVTLPTNEQSIPTESVEQSIEPQAVAGGDTKVEIVDPTQAVISEKKTKKPLSKKMKIIVAVIVTVVVLGAGVAAYLLLQRPSPQATETVSSSVDEADVVPDDEYVDDETASEELPKVSYHITSWDYRTQTIDSRIKLPTKSSENEYTYDKYEYKKIAVLSDGAVLTRLTTDNGCGMSREKIYFIVTETKLLYAKNLSTCYADSTTTYGGEAVSATIPELTPTEAITYNGQTFSSSASEWDQGLISDYSSDYTVTMLTTTKLGKLYEIRNVVDKANSYMSLRAYDLETQDKITHRYTLDSAKIANDDATLKATWNDSVNAKLTFTNPLRGCGAAYSNSDTLLTFAPDLTTAIRVGSVKSSGKPMYRLTTSSFVKSMYEEYTSGRDDKISLAKFQNELTHVVFQDGYGNWVLLQNSQFGPNAECAKPVVYLYPTKTTVVNVAVGADVRLSEPYYPDNGWRKVIARPSGALLYNGKFYDSLFWEGQGYGFYPETSGIGTVVTQDTLLSTIRKQLKQQGLNAKEMTDFMEFWYDKLPKTPYVKLTWLTTRQMDTLAPLNITPKPDTVIRVFLDARGLDAPVDLSPQALRAPARQGFTVVEWGGLR